MTLTDEDLTILESLDFVPTCCSNVYHPSDRPPAKWVAFFTPSPCGCTKATVRLHCDGCKDVLLRAAYLHCPRCNATYPTAGYVIRIEPL